MKRLREFKSNKLLGGTLILIGVLIILLSYSTGISQEIFRLNDLEAFMQQINVSSDTTLETAGVDPKISLLTTGGNIKNIEINIETISTKTMNGQIFYGNIQDEFSESNSKLIELKTGVNKIEFESTVKAVRIDPDDRQGVQFRINSIQVNYAKGKVLPSLISALLIILGVILICKKEFGKTSIIGLVLYVFLALYVIALTYMHSDEIGLPIMYIIFILNILIFIICNKFKISTSKIYVLIMIVSVAQMVFITPIFEIPDEQDHFYRGYALSQGDLVMEYNAEAENDLFGPYGVYLPNNLRELFCVYTEGVENQKVSLGQTKYVLTEMHANEAEESFYAISNTKPYIFTSYLPQSIGIGIARVLNLPAGFLVYFGRIINGLIALIIIIYAMKMLPKFKELIFLITMLPTNLQLIASNSPDALMNSMGILYMALIIHYVMNRKKVKKVHTLLLIGIPIYISGIKIPYLLLSLLIYVLNDDNSVHKYYRTKVFIMSLLGAVIVYKLNGMAYMAGETIAGSQDHISFILSAPIEFALLLFNTCLHYMQYWIETGIGRIALINESLSWIVIYGFMGLLILTTLKEHIKLDKRQMIIIAIYIVGLIGAILVGAFTWFPLPMSIIHGIQGRYFIPIVFPLLVGVGGILANALGIRIERISNKVYIYGTMFLTGYHFIELFSRYYLV